MSEVGSGSKIRFFLDGRIRTREKPTQISDLAQIASYEILLLFVLLLKVCYKNIISKEKNIWYLFHRETLFQSWFRSRGFCSFWQHLGLPEHPDLQGHPSQHHQHQLEARGIDCLNVQI